MVKFHELGTVDDRKLEYAAISTIYNSKFLYVKHKERKTWEIPGGRREPKEDINETGERELIEETGAEKFDLVPICEYSVTIKDKTTYGRLFFSNVYQLGQLPNFEINEVKLFENIPDCLTYPEIQPVLQKKALDNKPK